MAVVGLKDRALINTWILRLDNIFYQLRGQASRYSARDKEELTWIFDDVAMKVHEASELLKKYLKEGYFAKRQ